MAASPPLRGPLFMMATVGGSSEQESDDLIAGEAVVRHLVEVDRADPVHRANQLLLDVPGQVAAVEEVELAESEAQGQAQPLSEVSGYRRGAGRRAGSGRPVEDFDHMAARGQDQDRGRAYEAAELVPSVKRCRLPSDASAIGDRRKVVGS